MMKDGDGYMGTILEELRRANMQSEMNFSAEEKTELNGVYRCRVCGYIFDEAAEKRSIATLEKCPLCNVGMTAFQRIR